MNKHNTHDRTLQVAQGNRTGDGKAGGEESDEDAECLDHSCEM
jgi:hypothetical protein